MSEFKQVWPSSYLVHSYEVDMYGRVTVPNLCRYLQESAYYHAEHLGVGHSALSRQNKIWMLLGLAIRMNQYPKWNDTIQVQTWPSRNERIYYFRDYSILINDLPVGVATTKWIIVDLENRRPSRDKLDFHTDYNAAEKVWPEALIKVPPVESEIVQRGYPVSFADLDVNEHVNNIRYIEWVLDSMPLDFHKSHQLREFEILFQSEALSGDVVQLKQDEVDGMNFVHSLIRESDQKEICRARSAWQKNGL